jgi:rubrerythrin
MGIIPDEQRSERSEKGSKMLDHASDEAGADASADDHVAFFAAGVRVAGAYTCSECAYGVMVRGPLPACPMCAGRSWEAASWRPFSRRDRPR